MDMSGFSRLCNSEIYSGSTVTMLMFIILQCYYCLCAVHLRVHTCPHTLLPIKVIVTKSLFIEVLFIALQQNRCSCAALCWLKMPAHLSTKSMRPLCSHTARVRFCKACMCSKSLVWLSQVQYTSLQIFKTSLKHY